MKVRDLKLIIDSLDQDKDIFITILSNTGEDDELDGMIMIAPVTESCDDHTVIGYMITNIDGMIQ